MPSMSEGRNRSLDRLSGFCHQVPNMHTAMPTAFGMLPWQQATHPQQYAYPMPFPVVMPQINPHPQWSFPVDNFASLPPKAKIENGDCSSPIQEPVVKPARRYSDPGPILSDEEREKLEMKPNLRILIWLNKYSKKLKFIWYNPTKLSILNQTICFNM